MSEEKAIKPVPQVTVQALTSKYDPATDRMVAVSRESPLPVLPLISINDPALPVETREGESVDAFIQDQTTPIVDLHLVQELGVATIAVGASIDDTSITFAAGHGISANETLCVSEGTHYYQGRVPTGGVTGNVVDLETPLDFAFTTAAIVRRGNENLSVDGSVTPIIFRVSPKDLIDGTRWDITRMLVVITDGTAMDDGKFGGISALALGVVFRAFNGNIKNIFNAQTNGMFAQHAFDVVYSDKAPAGEFGVRVRRSFAGQDKNGVTIRLDAITDDEFQVIVQDDLTDLLIFSVVAQGHVVED